VGIWGLAFLLPFRTTSFYKKGMVIAIAQAIVMLVIIFQKWALASMVPSSVPQRLFLSSFSPPSGVYWPQPF
jgi:hypothetical protein